MLPVPAGSAADPGGVALRAKHGIDVAGARTAAFQGHHEGTDTACGAARKWTAAVDGIVAALDADIVRELGPPPAAYVILAAGSYARRELSPYSDVDYCILVEHTSPEIKEWFGRYASCLAERLSAVDPGGLCACKLISPTGAAGDGFIDTPEGMAKRLAGETPDMASRPLRDRDYFQTALASTRLVAGRGDADGLALAFERRSKRALGPAHPAIDRSSARWELIEMLRRSLRDPFGVPDEVPGWLEAPDGSRATVQPAKKHVPIDPEEAIRTNRVNIKHDLLKALQIPLAMLRLLHDVPAASGDELLARLVEKGALHPGLAKKLGATLEACLKLRFDNHLALGSGEDRLRAMSDADRRAIRRMVPILFRLRQEMESLAPDAPRP